jgi:hypothetical protein
MSADNLQEYPFDLGFTTSSSTSFAELDLSQSQQPSEMLTSTHLCPAIQKSDRLPPPFGAPAHSLVFRDRRVHRA